MKQFVKILVCFNLLFVCLINKTVIDVKAVEPMSDWDGSLNTTYYDNSIGYEYVYYGGYARYTYDYMINIAYTKSQNKFGTIKSTSISAGDIFLSELGNNSFEYIDLSVTKNFNSTRTVLTVTYSFKLKIGGLTSNRITISKNFYV